MMFEDFLFFLFYDDLSFGLSSWLSLVHFNSINKFQSVILRQHEFTAKIICKLNMNVVKNPKCQCS